MTTSNLDLARAYFQAVQNGDMAALGDLLDEQIVWHQPGTNRFSGDHRGQGAVFQMLGGMMEASQGTFAIDKIHSLMGNGDLVAAAIHFTGRRGDASMAMDGVDLLRITGGKITEMWLFSGDQNAEDAFWGN
ncbi:nuclear transport factor 2 family protein [Streptomyces roseirectus]|uniref:Nuclear transport factor 2 family protein n=1 Tax=Streptomyces roseirectus TaxID=2768066 RepID=A0A7H0I7R7_9ACTN|nr:nuclear transport factor 2 family protein [Streptomyces roseirectus]QNP68833.1 nuclear transport factor 2 family protein [Streptomyces roseirectus]